jgi:quercetin dioxygenase-like cupin family protein
MKTQFSTAGDGFELTSPDAKITVKVDAAHTGGAYELFEVDAPRGSTMPPHREPWAKTSYVLHGRMAVLVDGEGYDVGPGSSIAIPAGASNTFTVHTPSVQFLAISLTDALGRFFRDVERAVPAGTPPEDAAPRLRDLVGRHGVTLEGS